jgi:hypothetical protein
VATPRADVNSRYEPARTTGLSISSPSEISSHPYVDFPDHFLRMSSIHGVQGDIRNQPVLRPDDRRVLVD